VLITILRKGSLENPEFPGALFIAHREFSACKDLRQPAVSMKMVR
jgi:hypothetical protein